MRPLLRSTFAPFAATLAVLATAGCSEPTPGAIDVEPGAAAFSEISDDEMVTLLGTEPFWSMVIEGDQLTYSTPENMDGEVIAVERFSGNNGMGYSGTLEAGALEIAVTPGQCSDGMSDRVFPFTATVTLGGETLFGCAHTDAQSFIEPG